MANDFLPFGVAGGANVIDQATFAALPARLQGFVAGVALSAQLNKVWRQSSSMAAMLGEYISAVGGLDALDNGDITALRNSLVATLRAQTPNYAVVGGTANALTATLSPAPASYAALATGTPLRLLIQTTNTGAATLNLNGLGTRPIVTGIGTALARGDLPSNSIASVIWNGASFVLDSLAFSQVPIVGAPTIYVRTDGNDNNDGSANTAGSALATIAAAVERTRRYFGASTATIILGNAGTYTSPGDLGFLSIPLLIASFSGNPADCILVGAGTLGSSVFHVSSGNVRLQGVTVQNTAANNPSVGASSTASLGIQDIRFTNIVANNASHIWATDRSTVSVGVGVQHIGTAAFGWWANGGTIVMGANVTANMAATTAFAYATETGRISRGDASFFFSGTVTVGARYIASMNGVIQTNGGGANFFPGASAGSTPTGGQYG